MAIENATDGNVLNWVWGAIAGAFATMGGGFLYLSGQTGDVEKAREKSVGDIWQRLDNDRKDAGSVALAIEQRFATKDDLRHMEGRLIEAISRTTIEHEARIRASWREDESKR